MSETNKIDGRALKKLLKAAIEAAGPDLRKVMAQPRRAVVTDVRPAGGRYVCSVRAVKADNRPDENAPVIPDVEIPVLWAGPDRGLVCPPKIGEFCDLGFYDGDPNSPFIMGFRPNGAAPAAELDGLTCQHSADVLFGFRPDGTFFVKAPKVEVEAGETVIVKAGGKITLEAPLIEFKGAIKQLPYPGGGGGAPGSEWEGDVRVRGNVSATESVTAGGSITDAGGNTNHHSH